MPAGLLDTSAVNYGGDPTVPRGLLRRSFADLLIAATAPEIGLGLSTTNSDDLVGLSDLATSSASDR